MSKIYEITVWRMMRQEAKAVVILADDEDPAYSTLADGAWGGYDGDRIETLDWDDDINYFADYDDRKPEIKSIDHPNDMKKLGPVHFISDKARKDEPNLEDVPSECN